MVYQQKSANVFIVHVFLRTRTQKKIVLPKFVGDTFNHHSIIYKLIPFIDI